MKGIIFGKVLRKFSVFFSFLVILINIGGDASACHFRYGESNLLNIAEEGDVQKFITQSKKIRQKALKAQREILKNNPNDSDAKEKFEYYKNLNFAAYVDSGFGSFSVLFYAARGGKVEMIKYLIDNGADVNKANALGMTPLMAAVYDGRYKAFRYLVKRGARLNVKDNIGYYPLHYAAKADNTEIAANLISLGADINIQDEIGQTPLYKAIGNGHLKVAEFLIDNGAKVNYRDNAGVTPLHVAVYNKQHKIIEMLIRKGAKVNVYDYECSWGLKTTSYSTIIDFWNPIHKYANIAATSPEAPLDIAFSKKDRKSAEILMENGAVVDNDFIVELVKDKNVDMIKLITINSSYLHYRIFPLLTFVIMLICIFVNRIIRKKDDLKNVKVSNKS